MEWLALIVFAAFDYVGYNTLGQWNKKVYRTVQYILQAALTWGMWQLGGWFPAVAWLWLWWAWWADLFYYIFFDLLEFFGYGDDDGAFTTEVIEGDVTWAWWTPLGLWAWGVSGIRENKIPGPFLLKQAFLMLIIYGIAKGVAEL